TRPTTETHTLSLHDALPILRPGEHRDDRETGPPQARPGPVRAGDRATQGEQHSQPPHHRLHSRSSTARGPTSDTEPPFWARRPSATWPWNRRATAPLAR